MEGRSVKRGVISYNAAMSACKMGGQWAKALGLFNSMKGRGVIQNAVS